MTAFVKKGTEVKEVQTEDLSYYYSVGYKKCEAPVQESTPVKKGTKRTEEED